MAEEANYEKPTSQVDLESRLENENAGTSRFLSTADQVVEAQKDADAEVRYQVEGNEVEEYIGTDPIYQNYAGETHQPFPADGAERVVEEEVASSLAHIAPGVEVGSQETVVAEKEAQAGHGVGMPESDTETDPHTPQDALLKAKKLKKDKKEKKELPDQSQNQRKSSGTSSSSTPS